MTPTRVGLTRRVQALRAIGWTTTEIARMTGLDAGTIRRLALDDHTPVTTQTAQAVVTGYLRAQNRIPADSRSPLRRRQRDAALAAGWAPPFAWDNLDDPDELPTGTRPPRAHDIPSVEEAVLLLQLRVSPDEVARRLGVKPTSLARRLRRAQEHGWAALVERRDPS